MYSPRSNEDCFRQISKAEALPDPSAKKDLAKCQSRRITVPCCGIFVALLVFQIALPVPVIGGELVLTGESVEGLTEFDDALRDFMEQYDSDDNDFMGIVLAVSKDGCVVYQRGIGEWVHGTGEPMWENTMMRLASVEKPLVAAVIRDLIAEGAFDLDDDVFSPTFGGILQCCEPYNGEVGDLGLLRITVEDLLHHQGGWYRNISGDPMFAHERIAEDLGVCSPPGRENIVRWVMAHSLDFTPGDGECPDNIFKCTVDGQEYDRYSNFGYMVLGLLIEQYTGQTVADAIRTRILTPDKWIPRTEIETGATRWGSKLPREPRYMSSYPPGRGIWCYEWDDIPEPEYRMPYGGWHHEALQGHGNLVASAVPLLRFLDQYVVDYPNIGMPLSTPGTGSGTHGGALDGTSTVATQRSDGINIAVLINRRNEEYATILKNRINTIISESSNLLWPLPGHCVDGFWVDPNATDSGFGGFSNPFATVQDMVDTTTDGSKVHFQRGTSPWHGELKEKLLLDAPFGSVVIGQ